MRAMSRVLLLGALLGLLSSCAREVADGGQGGQAGGQIVWTGKARDGGACSYEEPFVSATANFEAPQHLGAECGEPVQCNCPDPREGVRVECVELAPGVFAWGDCRCRGEWPDGALCDEDADCQHGCVEGICAQRCATDADCPGGWVCEPAWGNVPDLVCQVPCCNGEECGVSPLATCWRDTPGGGRSRCQFDYDRAQRQP